MKHAVKILCRRYQGAALIVSMIFMLIFSSLAVSMATFSNVNLQIADNLQKADSARFCAESGLEIIRFWLNRISIPGTTPQSQIFNEIANSLQSDLTSNGITNITTYHNGSTITIPSVTLNSASGQSFQASITQLDSENLQADITGIHDTITRTIRVNYKTETKADTVFDYGVASKGPLSLAGNIELEGVNVAVESDVYIESENEILALSITGNSRIAGNVSIANPIAVVDLQGGQASIGGETGQAAIDNHVSFGVPPSDFPEPNPSYFEPYLVNIIDADTDVSLDATFENVRIVAGTNPNFTGNVTLKGIVFIETPNIVRFAGSAQVIGIIVGDGDVTDDSCTNHIEFEGTVDSIPISELPDEPQFADLKDETGTFVMAPGFSVAFGGNFSTLNGSIACNGIQFYGNAGGTVNGSVINYSNEPMTLSGNNDLYFNRSGTTEIPAGFIPNIVLLYEPASYSEIRL